MSKENNIRKGMLSEKMQNYHAEPPVDAWDNIAVRLPRNGSRKIFFIVLSAAAGLALAITVGVRLIDREPDILIVEDRQDEKSSPAIAPSRLEERVLVALEDAILEKEEELESIVQTAQVIIAENIAENLVEQDTESITENSEDATEGIDEQQQAGEREGVLTDERVESEDKISQEASQRYLDSLSNVVIPDEKITQSEEIKTRKWQLGAALTPLFSYRDASSPNQAQNIAANNSESGVMAYSGGVQIRYAQSKRLTFESGLYYNKMGLAIGDFETYRSGMDYLVADVIYRDNSIVSMSNSIGTISSRTGADVVVNSWTGAAPESYASLDSKEMRVGNDVVSSFVQSLDYLEIPFNVKYKVVDRDLKVLLIGGFSTNLLIGNQVFANTNGGKMEYGSVADIRTVNYAGNAGLGFVYEFTGNFSLSLEPRFKYYLNSINEDYLPVTRPFALGLYTGVNYTF